MNSQVIHWHSNRCFKLLVSSIVDASHHLVDSIGKNCECNVTVLCVSVSTVSGVHAHADAGVRATAGGRAQLRGGAGELGPVGGELPDLRERHAVARRAVRGPALRQPHQTLRRPRSGVLFTAGPQFSFGVAVKINDFPRLFSPM